MTSKKYVRRTDDSTLDSKSDDLMLAMGLPLVDGVFATLALTGVVGTIAGVISTGLLIFGGSLMII